jgi:glutaredoxin 3
MMPEVLIYSTGYCPYCTRAKQLLESKGVSYTEIRVDDHPEKRDEMTVRSNQRTVPQIFIDGQGIGGCDDLYALDHTEKLDKLLRG